MLKYGDGFLEEIRKYARDHQLSSKMSLKQAKRIGKPRAERVNDTKRESFSLFRAGKTIPEIAKVRELNRGTIEGHLAYFILENKLAVTELVPEEKIPAIAQAIRQQGDQALGPIKNALGDGFSYGEIRAVVNHLKKEAVGAS